jgi:tRNA threonylcarbamoyladenosine biosynthesis protein TsaE
MELIVTLTNMKAKAVEFWKISNGKKVIAFNGAMGSGKTTFIHALCEVKRVSSTISSPTFSIINEYLFPGGIIYHIDLYRLKDEDEAIRTGVEDCLYSDNICLVEWPEKAPGIFPETTLHIHVDFVDTQTRRLRLGDK